MREVMFHMMYRPRDSLPWKGQGKFSFKAIDLFGIFEPIYYELKIGPLSQRETDFSK